jgi:hypothetical protein
MPTGRWDFLADQRPRDLQTYVLDEVASRLDAELRRWPPPDLFWLDDAERLRSQPVLDRLLPLPLPTVRAGLALARCELLREVEAIDRFLRSPEARELLPIPLEEQTALLLSRWLTESLLEFQEAAQGKFKRPDLAAVVERLEERWTQGLRLRFT